MTHFQDPRKPRGLGWLLGLSIVWLALGAVFRVLRGRAQDREQGTRDGHDGLAAAAHLLHRLVAASQNLDGNEDGTLRVTVHRVVPSGVSGKGSEWLEQVIPYVGGKGGMAGRRFPVRSGIIGFRTPYAASRRNPDHGEFMREMVKEWGYTEEDAKGLTADRFAWMAVLIMAGRPEDVIGVVYLDLSQPHFFTQDIKALIVQACGGVAA